MSHNLVVLNLVLKIKYTLKCMGIYLKLALTHIVGPGPTFWAIMIIIWKHLLDLWITGLFWAEKEKEPCCCYEGGKTPDSGQGWSSHKADKTKRDERHILRNFVESICTKMSLTFTRMVREKRYVGISRHSLHIFTSKFISTYLHYLYKLAVTSLLVNVLLVSF